MKVLAQGLFSLAVLGALAAGALVAGGAVPRAAALDGYALYAGALLMLWLVFATRAASGSGRPSAYDRALHRRHAPPRRRPATLERIEREVAMASASAFDFHLRLRPRLRAIANHRLAGRRGLRLDAGDAEVRSALGDELWELLRPDRPAPEDRLAPGLAVERQRAALDALERI